MPHTSTGASADGLPLGCAGHTFVYARATGRRQASARSRKTPRASSAMPALRRKTLRSLTLATRRRWHTGSIGRGRMRQAGHKNAVVIDSPQRSRRGTRRSCIRPSCRHAAWLDPNNNKAFSTTNLPHGNGISIYYSPDSQIPRSSDGRDIGHANLPLGPSGADERIFFNRDLQYTVPNAAREYLLYD